MTSFHICPFKIHQQHHAIFFYNFHQTLRDYCHTMKSFAFLWSLGSISPVVVLLLLRLFDVSIGEENVPENGPKHTHSYTHEHIKPRFHDNFLRMCSNFSSVINWHQNKLAYPGLINIPINHSNIKCIILNYMQFCQVIGTLYTCLRSLVCVMVD